MVISRKGRGCAIQGIKSKVIICLIFPILITAFIGAFHDQPTYKYSPTPERPIYAKGIALEKEVGEGTVPSPAPPPAPTSSTTMETTAYTWTGNRTATGVWPSRGAVAVDPRVIPLGTKLYIEGYGEAVAVDTGEVIKGEIIDLYMDSREECVIWGRRQVQVEILKD